MNKKIKERKTWCTLANIHNDKNSTNKKRQKMCNKTLKLF